MQHLKEAHYWTHNARRCSAFWHSLCLLISWSVVIHVLQDGFLIAHQDSDAHYQQPVLLLQVRSESALSLGYKLGRFPSFNQVNVVNELPTALSF